MDMDPNRGDRALGDFRLSTWMEGKVMSRVADEGVWEPFETRWWMWAILGLVILAEIFIFFGVVWLLVR